jgi:predicted Zn finger-like uncharacterized protein
MADYIIECPFCGAQTPVNEKDLPKEPVQVQCTKCSNTYIIDPSRSGKKNKSGSGAYATPFLVGVGAGYLGSAVAKAGSFKDIYYATEEKVKSLIGNQDQEVYEAVIIERDDFKPSVDVNIENEFADIPVVDKVELTLDNLSFGQAFATARNALGPGGVFEWKGKLFNTYYKEEWETLGKPPVQADTPLSYTPKPTADIINEEIPVAKPDVTPAADQDGYVPTPEPNINPFPPLEDLSHPPFPEPDFLNEPGIEGFDLNLDVFNF